MFKFNSYVCPGDTITWSCEGYDFVARLERDYDTKPTDSECYDDADIQRWKNDEWFYGGLVLSVSRNGVQLSDHAASLWGIECNFGKDNDYLTEVAHELQGEAFAVAYVERARIREALEV